MDLQQQIFSLLKVLVFCDESFFVAKGVISHAISDKTSFVAEGDNQQRKYVIAEKKNR